MIRFLSESIASFGKGDSVTRPIARFVSSSTDPNILENSITISESFFQAASSGYQRDSTGHLPWEAKVCPSQYSRMLFLEPTIMGGRKGGGPCPTQPEPLGGASSSAVDPSSLSGVSRNLAMYSITSVFGAMDLCHKIQGRSV